MIKMRETFDKPLSMKGIQGILQLSPEVIERRLEIFEEYKKVLEEK